MATITAATQSSTEVAMDLHGQGCIEPKRRARPQKDDSHCAPQAMK
ncbi:MAG: hypothetical protein KatS3mg111_0808 [Pirellulaceae bacterium]|nr:MAG: hypothetical protein KatS3mg111_0808 [Pirellulaceae bacterium]